MKRCLSCWLAVVLLGSACGAEPPAPRKKGPMEKGSDLASGAWEWVRQREFVEMLSAVASGSQMGPGDGWFKASQSRYDFGWLCRQFDAPNKSFEDDLPVDGNYGFSDANPFTGATI